MKDESIIKALQAAYEAGLANAFGIDEESFAILKQNSRSIAETLSQQLLSDDVGESFLSEWFSLWPTKEELESKNVRRTFHKEKMESKLKTFIKEFYKNTGIRCSTEKKKELIMSATQAYIRNFRTGKDEWQFISDGANFISHPQKGSKLASFIKYNDLAKPSKIDHKTIIG